MGHSYSLTSWLLLGSWCLASAIVSLMPCAVQAQPPAELSRLSGSRQGSLVIAGGGSLPKLIHERFLELGGGSQADLVIVTSASIIAESPDLGGRLSYWQELGPRSLTLLHAKSRDQADDPEFCKPLRNATAVWFVGGNQNWVCERYLGTRCEVEFHQVLARGGVIGGTSAGAAIMSRTMIAGGRNDPIMATGLGFLPGTIVDQHFLRRNRQDRMNAALQYCPGLVGIGIDEETALVCKPDGYEVIGNSDLVVSLAPSHNRPAVIKRIGTGQELDLGPYLVAAAGRARFGAYSKAEKHPAPNLQNGSVVIAGNRPPREAVQEFLAAAGGKDAPVVVVAESHADAADPRQVQAYLAEMGAENVVVCTATEDGMLPGMQVTQCLAVARGVWFVGGREERLLNVVARSALRGVVSDVLARGGAIGGSSAGARIYGDGLFRHADRGNLDQTADDDCGLGVLAGIVINPDRGDNASPEQVAGVLRERFPNCVGLGLKDAAAVIVRGHTMQVVGHETVSIIEQTVDKDAPREPAVIPAGKSYDFLERRLVSTAADAGTR